MDDFSGRFCNEGVFPVISAVSSCFKAAMTTTTTTTTTTSTTATYVFEEFDVNDPPRRPVVNVILQGNLMDKGSIFGKPACSFVERAIIDLICLCHFKIMMTVIGSC